MEEKQKKPSLMKSFIKDKKVASVFPTSLYCVRNICTRIDFSRDFCLVEYGPGNGVFTDYILKKASPNSRVIAIEKNKELSDYLEGKNKDKRLRIFNDDARNVKSILDSLEIKNVDYVLSGIPFSFIEPKDIKEILKNTKKILNSKGKFLIYQATKTIGKYLSEYFKNIETKKYKLNIPPLYFFDVQ